MKKRKKNSKNKVYGYFVFTIVFIAILLIYGIYLLCNKTDTNSLLINKSYDVVYTSYEDKDYEKQIPALNIKGISKDINTNINNFVNPYLDKMTNKIYYNYEINGNILSLIIIVENYEIEGPADYKYMSYIIDLKELDVLSNDEVYKLFGLNEEYLIRVLNDKFKSYYDDSIKKNIIKSNITYNKYLQLHEISNFKDQMYCYISKGKLHIYLDYNEWPSNETINYFANIGHDFEIAN